MNKTNKIKNLHTPFFWVMERTGFMSFKDKNSACPGIYHMPQARDGRLCRIRLEQGHLTAAQLRLLAGLAFSHGNGMIELTSRANIQLRGIKSESAASLVHALEEGGLAPITPAGDGVRNVMVNPTAGFDPQTDERILPLARQLSIILQTTPRYQTLSPKFSILLDGGEACAIIHHISDIWLSLCDGGKNFAFGLASRPPLEAEIPTALGKVPANKAQDLILKLIDLLLEMRQQHPQMGRMKHLLEQFPKSVKRFSDKNCGRNKELENSTEPSEVKNALVAQDIFPLLQQKLPFMERAEDFRRSAPKPYAHLGIQPTKEKSRFYLGLKPPLGRLNPAQARFIADKMVGEAVRLIPWQSLILPALDHDRAQKQEKIFASAGFITSPSQALAHIVCCTGSPGCGAAKSDVLGDAKELARALEGKNFAPIHLTGCAKSCAVSEAKAITLIARGGGIYDLFTADKNASAPFGRLVATAITINQIATNLTQQGTKLLPKSHC